jgi:hypothetical protein
VKYNQGQDLLSAYRMALFQLREANNETIRIGNLCSTRMSAVQQTMNEEFEAVRDMDKLLNQVPKINAQLDEIHKQLGELHRHMLQIELSLACLQSSAAKEAKNSSIIDIN